MFSLVTKAPNRRGFDQNPDHSKLSHYLCVSLSSPALFLMLITWMHVLAKQIYFLYCSKNNAEKNKLFKFFNDTFSPLKKIAQNNKDQIASDSVTWIENIEFRSENAWAFHSVSNSIYWRSHSESHSIIHTAVKALLFHWFLKTWRIR